MSSGIGDKYRGGADRRLFIGTGPFNIRPGEKLVLLSK
jgi:hypothetical protein